MPLLEFWLVKAIPRNTRPAMKSTKPGIARRLLVFACFLALAAISLAGGPAGEKC